eukprot:6189726-Alexandrium_andersonii.AAC.1
MLRRRQRAVLSLSLASNWPRNEPFPLCGRAKAPSSPDASVAATALALVPAGLWPPPPARLLRTGTGCHERLASEPSASLLRRLRASRSSALMASLTPIG